MSNVARIPLAQGTRVRVIAEHRPPPPHDRGIIWKHRPENGGYLVQHDSSPFEEGPLAEKCVFGWAYSEIEVEEPKVAANPHPAGPRAGRLPRTPAEQHRSLMETLLALRAAEGGIAETREEEILARLDGLWTQLTEAEWSFEKQTVAAHGEAVLETMVTADCWMRTPLLETDDPHHDVFLVTSITLANVKVPIGAHGAPLVVINRFGTSLGEVLVRAGETIRVVVHNVDNREHAVWGRCTGSLKPNAGHAQRVVAEDK